MQAVPDLRAPRGVFTDARQTQRAVVAGGGPLAATRPADREVSSAAPMRSAREPRAAVLARGQRYDLQGVLGVGAMGEVRAAVDIDIGRRVAVKRLRDGSRRSELLREVRMVGALEHPNIVPIHDVDVDERGEPYLVMKHLEGQTLEEIIEALQRRDPAALRRWTVEAKLQVFTGIAQALAHAHARGVLHRDVKPGNVMVGAHGEVVLLDWGIAMGMDEPAVGLAGTPFFMSPEQARGEPLDARSDLYSAAVLLHELLTLEHYLEPLQDPGDVLRTVATQGWRWSLADWHRPRPQPMPPMELYHFLRRAMAFDRERRFPSAEAMLEEVRRIQEGRVRVQCHITAVKAAVRHTGRFIDRAPWLAIGLALVLTTLTVHGLATSALTLGSANFAASANVE